MAAETLGGMAQVKAPFVASGIFNTTPVSSRKRVARPPSLKLRRGRPAGCGVSESESAGCAERRLRIPESGHLIPESGYRKAESEKRKEIRGQKSEGGSQRPEATCRRSATSVNREDFRDVVSEMPDGVGRISAGDSADAVCTISLPADSSDGVARMAAPAAVGAT